MTRFLLVAVGVFALGGCASKRDIRDLQTELRALAERQDSLIAQLRRDALAEARQTQDTLRTQGNQIVDLRGEIMRQLRQMNDALTTLQQVVGENQRTISAVRDQLVNLRRSSPGPEPVTRGEPPAGTGAQQTGTPEQFYNTAVTQLTRGSVSTARRAFEQFLATYPNHELAPEARFHLADILVQENRLDEALAAFEEIPALFPTAETVPRALYRIALIRIERDELEQAEQILERIVNTYPEHGAALLAREKLEEIR